MNSGSVILRDDQTMLPYTMLTNTMTTVDGLVRQTMEARVQTHFSFPFLFVSAVWIVCIVKRGMFRVDGKWLDMIDNKTVNSSDLKQKEKQK